jgi:hypothetical protein
MNAWPQNKLKEIVDNEAAPINYLISALEDHAAKISAELEKARAAKARAQSYPTNAPEPLCPKCWKDGSDVVLTEIKGGGDDRLDIYRCHRCRKEYSLPF